MQKWEYYVWEGNITSYSRESLEQALTERGGDGWELVIAETNKFEVSTQSYIEIYIFKRPKED